MKSVVSFVLIIMVALSCKVHACDELKSEKKVSVVIPSWLQEIQDKQPIDFIQFAIDASQLRQQYAEVALSLLSSNTMTIEDKLQLSESLDPNVKVVKLLAKLPFTAKTTQESLTPMELPALNENPTKEELLISGVMILIKISQRQWSYFARSLQSYKGCGSPVFLNKLIKEFMGASSYAEYDLKAVQNMLGQEKRFNFFADEVTYSKALLESLVLHQHMSPVFESNEIKYYDYCLVSLGYRNKEAGSFFGKCFFDSSLLKFPQLIELLSNEIRSDIKEISESIKSNPIISGDMVMSDVELDVLLSQCHLPRIVNDKNRVRHVLRSSLAYQKRVRDFCLTPDCLDFDQYFKSFESELEDEKRLLKQQEEEKRAAVLASFSTPPFLAKKAAEKSSKKHKKGKNINQKRTVPTVVQPISNSAEVIETPVNTIEPSVKPIKNQEQKIPSKKEKRLEKKQAQLDERQQKIDNILVRAHEKEEAFANAISQIKVTYGDGTFSPSIEELEFYKLIWSPDSERKDLSWTKLSSTLKSYGWTIFGNGGSYQVLQPPVWFDTVQVIAPEEFKIHFHNAKVMVHKPHDEAQTPMPNYVPSFLRVAFERNIGLSELVVNAMLANLKS